MDNTEPLLPSYKTGGLSSGRPIFELTRTPLLRRVGNVLDHGSADVELKTAAVVATASSDLVAELDASQTLRDALRDLTRLQRDFSRKENGSANRRKAAAHPVRRHARVAAIRADRLHSLTAALLREHAVIVIENLAVANMRTADRFYPRLPTCSACGTVKTGPRSPVDVLDMVQCAVGGPDPPLPV